MSGRGKEKWMITAINNGEEEGRTMKSEDVGMLVARVRCKVPDGAK
jgi:hypothetical protein